jgi:hypothetical protein
MVVIGEVDVDEVPPSEERLLRCQRNRSRCVDAIKADSSDAAGIFGQETPQGI